MLREKLKELVDRVGGPEAMAEEVAAHTGKACSASTVRGWLYRQDREFPALRAAAIVEIARKNDFKITVEELLGIAGDDEADRIDAA